MNEQRHQRKKHGERERQTDRERERDRDRETERETHTNESESERGREGGNAREGASSCSRARVAREVSRNHTGTPSRKMKREDTHLLGDGVVRLGKCFLDQLQQQGRRRNGK
jgi:hypothetical protein